MRVFVKILVLSIVLGCVLLTGTGCPDSDPVVAANSQFMFTFGAANATGRYVDSPFDFATISVRNAALEAVDPITRDALGDLRIDVLQTNFMIDFRSGQVSMATQTLPAGTYRVAIIEITTINFWDTGALDPANFSDPMNPTCEDFVRQYSTNQLINILPTHIGEVIVQVLPDGSSFTIDWDWAQLIDALQQAQACDPGCGCPGAFDPMNPNDPGPLACICPTGNFNRGIFRDLSSDFFTFSTN
ncbi:MAG: hypothetical protein OEV00_05120 [Acidobacteriota bacterium]|nr:hypothetical protein [Acidobacteriota bacterium]MDH3784696.1 hypothetical protein [Acidobacteriota bacterium]